MGSQTCGNGTGGSQECSDQEGGTSHLRSWSESNSERSAITEVGPAGWVGTCHIMEVAVELCDSSQPLI